MENKAIKMKSFMDVMRHIKAGVEGNPHYIVIEPNHVKVVTRTECSRCYPHNENNEHIFEFEEEELNNFEPSRPIELTHEEQILFIEAMDDFTGYPSTRKLIESVRDKVLNNLAVQKDNNKRNRDNGKSKFFRYKDYDGNEIKEGDILLDLLGVAWFVKQDGCRWEMSRVDKTIVLSQRIIDNSKLRKWENEEIIQNGIETLSDYNGDEIEEGDVLVDLFEVLWRVEHDKCKWEIRNNDTVMLLCPNRIYSSRLKKYGVEKEQTSEPEEEEKKKECPLTDCKGNAIYEGDRLVDKNGKVGLVKFVREKIWEVVFSENDSFRLTTNVIIYLKLRQHNKNKGN